MSNRVYPNESNGDRYYDLAIYRYGMEPAQAEQWVRNQIGNQHWTNTLNPLSRSADYVNDRIDPKSLGINTAKGAVTGFIGGLAGGPAGAGLGALGGAVAGGVGSLIDDLTSDKSASRDIERASIARTQNLTNPDFNQPHYGHMQSTYPNFGRK